MNLTKILAAFGVLALVYLVFRVGAFLLRIVLVLLALVLVAWLVGSWLVKRRRRR